MFHIPPTGLLLYAYDSMECRRPCWGRQRFRPNRSAPQEVLRFECSDGARPRTAAADTVLRAMEPAFTIWLLAMDLFSHSSKDDDATMTALAKLTGTPLDRAREMGHTVASMMNSSLADPWF